MDQALFSMSFFNFTPGDEPGADRWRMSERFWVYWVVAVPATLITVLLWYYLQRRLKNSINKHSQKEKNDGYRAV
jgi:cytochrome c-type biogenesis protein CcmH/NrfF